MIRLSSVSKHFEDCQALDSLDLVVEEEQVTVLIGPSGCGKSTTLRCILGLVEPDEGTVEINGRNLSEFKGRDVLELRRRIGYVIQGGGLFPHFTARKNIIAMAEHQGWSRTKINDRIDHLVDITNFSRDRLDRYPSELSGGQKQRVSLMRALMLNPDSLLMDEPLGALDPMIRASLRQELDDIYNRLEKTVLMVTHDLDQAVFFGDKIVLLREGRVVQSGQLKDFQENPNNQFVTDFVNAQASQW